MSTHKLLAILKERGFRLTLLADGTPAIRGPVAEATPALLEVLKLPLHRERLLELLRRGEVS